MRTVVIIAAIGILAVIAYGDVRTRRIPNGLAGTIAVLGLARMMLAGDPLTAAHTFEAAAVVFTAAFLLFRRGVLGGGDAKLVAATALLIGSQDLLGFLFLMSMCGGVLALASLARDQLRRLHWQLSRHARAPSMTQVAGCITAPARSTVPYGVAIAAAGVITLVHGTEILK